MKTTAQPELGRLEHLRVDHLEDPLALARHVPRFGWHVVVDEVGAVQEAYRISIRRTAAGAPSDGPGEPIADTGPVSSAECVAVEVPGFAGAEGADYAWTLQVWLAGRPDPLVSGGTFGIGVTSWQAPWIEPQQEPVVVEGPSGLSPAAIEAGTPSGPLAERLHPPRHLRHKFRLEGPPVRARLRISSQGVHQPFLNGRPVDDGVLAPGYESYQHAISVMTHDVTDQLVAGENVLGVVLGDGWYAGRISFLGRSAQYGDLLRATWQLEVTDAAGIGRVIVPDEQVVASRGPIDWSDIFIGERHDARAAIPGWDAAGFDDSDPAVWTRCRTVPVEVPLRPFVGEPIRRVAALPVKEVLTTPAGETVLDFGQVLAGRVRMTVQGSAGTVVRLEHAEVVDADGNFLDNIHGVNKDQADEYVLAGDPGGETWEPLFTFHGFRYVKLIGYPGAPRAQDFAAVVIANDLEPTAGFSCSDPRLDQLFANTVWSQRSNFLAVPTDCPQRERAGWTGDLQIFVDTAATLMGVAAFLDRWLTNVRHDQAAHDGMVPVIVPEPPAMAVMPTEGNPFADITAAAGWADVITLAPWALYRHYGDPRFLSDNLAAMRDWVEFQTRDARERLPPRLRDVVLAPEQRARHEMLWNGRMNFGDWLAPSTLHDHRTDPGEAVMRAPRLTSELVGPVFQVGSLDALAAAAEVLHEDGLARDCRAQAAAVREAFAAEYLQPDGRMGPDLQGVYVLALAFDMVPGALREAVVQRLVELVHAADDHLDTGFLSVPHLLDVLWDNDHADLARTLLRQDTAPSWLYEVKMGATTIWENWHAVHEDGTVEIASMNHYAFGCVVDWMMRRLAGLGPIEPGYRTAEVAPDLDGFLDSCSAHVVTPYGRLGIEWRRDAQGADLTVCVPVGATAHIALPPTWQLDSGCTDLPAGRHRLRACPAAVGSGPEEKRR